MRHRLIQTFGSSEYVDRQAALSLIAASSGPRSTKENLAFSLKSDQDDDAQAYGAPLILCECVSTAVILMTEELFGARLSDLIRRGIYCIDDARWKAL